LKDVQFIVAGRRFAGGAIGLVGENLLGAFEVDYDFGEGKIGFYKVEGCGDLEVASWAHDWIRIEPPPGRFTEILGTVMVNGKRMRAKFDTGAGATIMTKGAAARAGLRPDTPGVKPSGGTWGIGHNVVKTWVAPVESFKIGQEEIKNTQIQFGDIDFSDVDMLLGIDFFLSHHVFVVHRQDRLYFTYSGGPVFKLGEPQEPSPPAASPSSPTAPDAAPSGATPSGATPSGATPSGAAPSGAVPAEAADPDTLDREGAALMARKEFEAALKAYTRAAELDPKTAQRWVKRAQAELALKRPVLAIADLDRALELKPDDVTARMMRGELLLRQGETDRAAADFEAAAKASPPGDDVRLRIAAEYERHERWAEAIPHLDAWLDVHVKESTGPGVLAQRCRARATLGRELDKALADCDAALRRERNPVYFETRGLVRLRQGRLQEAIEDYDTALRASPKLSWALYCRGLAKKRLGMTAEGDADILAAVALTPGLPARARRLGLVEADPPAKPADPKG
jgi:tetratricopeptide (TPR) repeat protein